MGQKQIFLTIFVIWLGLGFGAVVSASSKAVAARPVAVSPGAVSEMSLVESRCPTFSWGAVPGAKSYELVVYRVGEEGTEENPVLREIFSGSASTWTPSLERCLERGGQYAWSIRAEGGKAAPAWSSPNLFEVAAEPSRAVLDDRVQIAVRKYLATTDESETTSTRNSGSSSETGSVTSVQAPRPLAPAPTKLSVDGNVDAVTFTGDGSNLTGLRPDPPCFDKTLRFVDCGNGTVTDTVTGLIYLKNANCFGQKEWAIANADAAQLAHGACGLSDNSSAGDWRLQTKEEWDGIIRYCGFTAPPGLRGNGLNSFTSCYSDSPWASAVVSDHYWSSSTLINETTYAWSPNLNDGTMRSNKLKTESFYSWPVRGTWAEPGPSGPTGPTG